MQKALRNDSKVSFNEFSLYQRKNLSLYLKNIFIILGQELLFKNFDFNNRCKNEI